jgi:hypothetical protein
MTKNYKLWVTPFTPQEIHYNVTTWSSELACTNVIDTWTLIMDLVKSITEFINNSWICMMDKKSILVAWEWGRWAKLKWDVGQFHEAYIPAAASTLIKPVLFMSYSNNKS